MLEENFLDCMYRMVEVTVFVLTSVVVLAAGGLTSVVALAAAGLKIAASLGSFTFSLAFGADLTPRIALKSRFPTLGAGTASSASLVEPTEAEGLTGEALAEDEAYVKSGTDAADAADTIDSVSSLS
jgi:hypothetical protein